MRPGTALAVLLFVTDILLMEKLDRIVTEQTLHQSNSAHLKKNTLLFSTKFTAYRLLV